jgi:hypothetical protein
MTLRRIKWEKKECRLFFPLLMKSRLSIGADVMLPLVHLISRFSFRERNGRTYDADSNLTITFDEQKGQWVVNSCDSSSFVRLPPHGWDGSCSLPRNGGTFHLIIRDDSWYRGQELVDDCKCNSCFCCELRKFQFKGILFGHKLAEVESRYADRGRFFKAPCSATPRLA